MRYTTASPTPRIAREISTATPMPIKSALEIESTEAAWAATTGDGLGETLRGVRDEDGVLEGEDGVLEGDRDPDWGRGVADEVGEKEGVGDTD